MQTNLILGGARSGKSRRAQLLAENMAKHRIYVATAEGLDAEMLARIDRHRSDRGLGWKTVETPLDLVEAIKQSMNHKQVVIVDCLTLWLSNLMHARRDIEAESEALVQVILNIKGGIILVSNEVGMGLVPETTLGRNFRDAQGRLNQKIASVCEHVELVVAGLPLTIKG
ncbi:MAG: bifunctional adenosylcobinamide kinase/adenosylcobinamide-phosphate guanylyltransferase [Robiginitomaculum sp.]